MLIKFTASSSWRLHAWFLDQETNVHTNFNSGLLNQRLGDKIICYVALEGKPYPNQFMTK